MNLEVEYLGGNCPVQAEGTVNGVPFYFRARGQHWSFAIGPDPVAVSLGWEEGFYRSEEWGDSLFAAGWMEQNIAMKIIEKCAAEYDSSLLC